MFMFFMFMFGWVLAFAGLPVAVGVGFGVVAIALLALALALFTLSAALQETPRSARNKTMATPIVLRIELSSSFSIRELSNNSLANLFRRRTLLKSLEILRALRLLFLFA